ncbi:MAG: YccF domain-containing protein [Clostridiales bacterium]|nr:YccF domain-containing protein [Clostridiales bacterium]
MRILLNLLWFICGGFICWLEYAVLGVLLCLTIVGIPFGIQCFKLANLVAMPFGKELFVVPGFTSLFGNILWIILVGWETALTELIIGGILCLTVIGIPFGIQFIKLAGLTLMPFGSHVRIAHVF